MKIVVTKEEISDEIVSSFNDGLINEWERDVAFYDLNLNRYEVYENDGQVTVELFESGVYINIEIVEGILVEVIK